MLSFEVYHKPSHIPTNTWISPPTIRCSTNWVCWISPPTILCSTNWVWYELSSKELPPLPPIKNLITSIDLWQFVATASGQWILPITGLKKPVGSANVIMTPHTKLKAVLPLVLPSLIWLVLMKVFDVRLYGKATPCEAQEHHPLHACCAKG